jgi:hypothetical protein
MKLLVSILISVLILLSGMHVTVATHLCGGKIAAVKVSFTGKKASCGMESDEDKQTSRETEINAHCCDDLLSVYKAEINYPPVKDHYKISPSKIITSADVFTHPSSLHIHPSPVSSSDFRPPGQLLTSIVLRPEICVFRL